MNGGTLYGLRSNNFHIYCYTKKRQVCRRVCMSICECGCIYVCVYICVWVYMCVYVYMYYVCVKIYTITLENSSRNY